MEIMTYAELNCSQLFLIEVITGSTYVKHDRIKFIGNFHEGFTQIRQLHASQNNKKEIGLELSESFCLSFVAYSFWRLPNKSGKRYRLLKVVDQ